MRQSLLLLLSLLCALAQSQSPDRSERWLDLPFPGSILALSPTADDGFAATGFVQDTFGRESILLLKYDANLQREFARSFTFGNESVGRSISQTLDSSFVISGYSVNGLGGRDLAILKTDKNGLLVWFRQYGGSSDDVGDVILEDPSGGYLVGGSSSSFSSSQELYFVKTDLNGNLSWSATYGGNFLETMSGGTFNFEKGFFFCGESFSATLSLDPLVIALDPQGNFRWATIFPETGIAAGRSLQMEDTTLYLLSDGAGFISGENDIFLRQLDDAGEPVSNHRIGSPDFDRANAMERRGSGWTLTGFHRETGEEERPLLLRLDSVLQVEWAGVYGSPEEDLADDLIWYEGQQRWLAAGRTEGYQSQVETRPWMLFTTEAGDSDCDPLEPTFSVDTASLNFLHPQFVLNTNPGTQVFLATGSEAAINLADQTVCTLVGRSQPSNLPEVKVWPNPAHTFVRVSGREIEEAHLINAMGVSLHPYTVKQGDEIKIDLSDCSPGIYWIAIKSAEKQLFKTVLVH